MVQAVAADRTDQPFDERTLPRASWRDEDFLDAHRLDPSAEDVGVDAVPVADHVRGRRVPGGRLGDLPRRPLGRRVRRHVEVQDPAAQMSQHDEDIQHAVPHGRDGEEVGGREAGDVVRENARQVGAAGFGRFTMYLSTVDFATSMPTMRSSETIRGDPQVTLADDIWRVRSWISCGTGGRPGPGRPESLAQYSRNFRRRQAITVAGLTMTSTSRQRDQSRESEVQGRRSRRRRRGRGIDRW
jgi:hypothetical protein